MLRLFIVVFILLSCNNSKSSASEPYQNEHKKIEQLSQTLDEKKSELFENYVANPLNREIGNVPFQLLKGQSFNLADLKGKVVLIDVFATWCGPCKLISPYIESIKKMFPPEQLAVIGVSYESEDILSTFESNHPHKYDISHSATWLYDELEIKGFPTVVIIGPNGNVQYQHMGVRFDLPKKLEWQIEHLLSGLTQ